MLESSCSAAALVLSSGVAPCQAGRATGGEWSVRGLGAVVVRGGVGRLSGIVEPRRAERGGGDERSAASGGGGGAADAVNPLRAAMR